MATVDKGQKRSEKRKYYVSSSFFCKEHIAVQRKTNARTILLQSLPEDHMADFHHLDDARDIWLAVKARFGGNDESKKMRKSMLKQEFSEFRVSESEGLHKGYDRFQKILSQLNQMQAKPDNEDCNMNFDDLYNKLRTLKIDVKGGSSYDSRGTSDPTHSAFISAASTTSKMSYPDQSHSTTFTSASSSPTASSNVMENCEDVENGAAQVYGMIAGAEEDATGGATGNATGDVADDVSTAAAEFALMGISSQVQTCPFGCEHLYVELKKIDNVEAQYKDSYIRSRIQSTLQTLEQQKGWYQSNQLALEERIRILTANLENTTNMLKYTEKLNEHAKIEKLNDKVKFEESNARFDKWKDSSKNLDKLVNTSMSSRSKFGLGFGNTFGSDEVFDLSAPSIFDSFPKDGARKPLYDRFVKADGMNVVPPPITGTFMPPSNNPDLDDT
ncbi:hypothetical protein Tco_1516327 [Tanacetum coccineum]